MVFRAGWTWAAVAVGLTAAACNNNNGPGLNGACPDGQTSCGSICATLQNDINNCGACGTVCPGGQSCVNAQCAVACPSTEIVCGALCVDPKSDNNNCGACNHVCPAGQACGANGCAPTCGPGETLCGTQCVNLTNSNGNCGACATEDAGAVCPGGEVCSNSKCQPTCGTGYSTCTPDSGVAYCANLDGGDPDNCGACFNACGVGGACCVTDTGVACANVLNDANNCGSCGHACQGASCDQGVCASTSVASTPFGNPLPIAVDSNNIYFGASLYGVVELPKDGGAPNVLSDTPALVPGLAIDSTTVYWTDNLFEDVWQAPIDPDAGGAEPLGFLDEPQPPTPFGIAVDPAKIYYAGWDDAGYILSVDIGGILGLSLTTVATGDFLPNGLALDTFYVYWTDVDGGRVMRRDKGATLPIQTLASGQQQPAGITVDSQNVYWTDTAAGTVMALSLSDGGAPWAIASGQVTPSRIAVDAVNAYWTDPDAGRVMRASLDGGKPWPIAIDQAGPVGIAVDATRVYWTNPTGSSVASAPK
jgi:hypothetical protein